MNGLPKTKLFTVGNPKTRKGESLGYLTAVLHLAPHKSAGIPGKNVCPYASPECIALCLNTAGRGGIFKTGERTNSIQEARKRKTRAFFADRGAFVTACAEELTWLQAWAAERGLKLAVRVNGTSDIHFLSEALSHRFPGVPFYDYTKVPVRAWRVGTTVRRTFSRSESNAADTLEALRAGVNVAVVFSTKRGQPLPATYLGRRVIDGDDHDLRFLDPKSVVVGLRAKGRARKLCGGFVVDVSKLGSAHVAA